MNNCFCKASMFNRPLFGGYVDFENAEFYRENFNVQTYWGISTAIGGLIPFAGVFVAWIWWFTCKHLWSANERLEGELPTIRRSIDMQWLR
jgi:hypothetical protein